MTKKLTKVAMTTALAAAAIVPAVVATPAQAAEAEVTFAKAYYSTANGTAAFEAGKLAGVISATTDTGITHLEASNGEVFTMSAFSGYLAVNPTATTDEVLTALSKAGKALSADQVKALNVKEGKVEGGKVTVDADAPVTDVKVESVTAINGTVTVVFDKAPDAVPAVTDFKVTQNINGKTTAINASSVQWDAATKTAKLAVPTIYATEVDQNVAYTVGYKETAAKSSASFQVAKVTEVKVDSVTALNSKQIQVVFNQEMDKTSVETLANYKLSNVPKAATPTWNSFADTTAPATVAKLQDDKKTVIITLGDVEAIAGTSSGVLDNKTALGLQVAATNIKSTSGKVLETAAEIAFQLNDTQAPTVSKVEVNELGGLDVTFNEQIDATKGKITVNGFTYTITGADVNVANSKGQSTATIAKANLTDTTKAKLELGKSYTIAVSEQEDVYGEKATSVFSSSFTYAVNAVAPVLKSVTAVDEKSFILEFNKDVTVVAGTPLTVQVNKGAQQLATTTTSTAFDGRKTGQYKVTLATTDVALDVLYDRAKNETSTNLTVYIPAIKDVAGNITAAGNTSVTLSKDVTKPAVEKAVSTGTQLDVTLTEGVTATTDANLATGSYVLAENGRQIPVLGAGFTALSAGDKDFTFTYATGVTGGLTEGNYTLVIKKDTLTDQSLNNGNKNDEIRIPFAVGAGLQVKPEVTTAGVDATTTAGELVVNFTSPVTYQSVANYKNYKIDGIEIPSASTFTLDAAGTKLTIKLPEATYKETKDRVVSIAGARNLAGTAMAEYQAVAKVSENEEVKLQSAKVVGEDIILTFNENVETAAMSPAFVVTDFIVKVNGTDVGTVANALNNTTDTTKTPKVEKNQIRIEAPASTSFATGTITVEVKDGAAAKDAAGNKAKAVIVPVTR